jgi:hypothetical protein
MNYAALSATIQEYAENPFSPEVIATFVTQAEQRIFNTVQFPSLRKNVTGVTTSSNKYLSSPSDFLAVYSIAVISATGRYTYLINKDVNFIRQAYPNPASTGTPKHYALFGPTTTNTIPANLTNELSFILGPTPDTAYNVELHYFFYPESIVTAGTSWLGDNFDTVLLYGAMVEALTYMKAEADQLSLYIAKYTEALSMAKRLGDGLEKSDSYRSGEPRVPVT